MQDQKTTFEEKKKEVFANDKRENLKAKTR